MVGVKKYVFETQSYKMKFFDKCAKQKKNKKEVFSLNVQISTIFIIELGSAKHSRINILSYNQ